MGTSISTKIMAFDTQCVNQITMIKSNNAPH